MEKTVSVKCRVMFGQNILMQKKPVEGVITVEADGSDSIQELKTKIAVRISSDLILHVDAQALFPSLIDPSAYISMALM